MRGKLMTRNDSIPVAAWFVILTLAGIVVLAFATTSLARDSAMNEATLQGEVVAINHLHQDIGLLTLRGSDIGRFPADKLNIFVTSGTKVSVCSEPKSLNKISVSRDATVTYHEVRGLAVADNISEPC